MRKGLIFKLVAFGFALSLVPLINGCSEDSTTTPVATIQDTAPPAPPVGIDVEWRRTGAKISWTPNLESDLAGYNLWVYHPSPNSIQAYTKLNQELIAGTEYGCSKLPDGDPNHYFRLTAVDEYGNESAYSVVVTAEVPYVISK